MKTVKPALLLLALFTFVTGVIYPLAVTGVAQLLFPHQANGSLLRDGEPVVGSSLIGQSFDQPGDFWGRPSATGSRPYNAAASSGSNLGPSNPVLRDQVRERLARLGPGAPVDLVTSSASGLDPHISPAAAYFQIERVARARKLSPAAVRTLVDSHIEGRTFGLLGEPRLNVLQLNLALGAAYGGNL